MLYDSCIACCVHRAASQPATAARRASTAGPRVHELAGRCSPRVRWRAVSVPIAAVDTALHTRLQHMPISNHT